MTSLAEEEMAGQSVNEVAYRYLLAVSRRRLMIAFRCPPNLRRDCARMLQSPPAALHLKTTSAMAFPTFAPGDFESVAVSSLLLGGRHSRRYVNGVSRPASIFELLVKVVTLEILSQSPTSFNVCCVAMATLPLKSLRASGDESRDGRRTSVKGKFYEGIVFTTFRHSPVSQKEFIMHVHIRLGVQLRWASTDQLPHLDLSTAPLSQ